VSGIGVRRNRVAWCEGREPILEAQFLGVFVEILEAVRVQRFTVRVLQQDLLDLRPPFIREVQFVDVLGDCGLIEQTADGELGGEAAGGGPAPDQGCGDVCRDDDELLRELCVVADGEPWRQRGQDRGPGDVGRGDGIDFSQRFKITEKLVDQDARRVPQVMSSGCGSSPKSSRLSPVILSASASSSSVMSSSWSALMGRCYLPSAPCPIPVTCLHPAVCSCPTPSGPAVSRAQ
jgi:hypothetical protein